MTTITRAKETGRAGRDANSAMADLWRSAEMLDQNLLTDEQRARGEHWVPWRAVEIRHDILPRADRIPDQATVNEYVGIFEHLPAIEVQQDSLVLIDGLHRLSAAPKAGRDHIRVIEQDAADDELWRLAFRANVGHGHRLTLAEKRTYAKRLLKTLPDADEWSDAAIGRETGLHRQTIASVRLEVLRERSHGRKPSPPAPATLDQSEPIPEEPAQGALPLSHGGSPATSVPLAQGDSDEAEQLVLTKQPETADESDEPPAFNKEAPTEKPARTSSDKTLATDYNDALRVRRHDPNVIAGKLKVATLAAQLRAADRMVAWWTAMASALRVRLGGG